MNFLCSRDHPINVNSIYDSLDPNRGRLRLSFIIMHEILNAAQQTNPVNENSWTTLIIVGKNIQFLCKTWGQ